MCLNPVKLSTIIWHRKGTVEVYHRDGDTSCVYYKYFTIVNDNCKWHHNYKHDHDHNWWLYKHITIVNDASGVMLQIVASLRIASLRIASLWIVTYDRHLLSSWQLQYVIVEATGISELTKLVIFEKTNCLAYFIRAKCYKTFYARNLRMFAIS